MLNYEFSVVIPVFNGDRTLPELTNRIKEVFSTLQKTYEIVYVNDASKDNSWHVIQQLCKQHLIAIKIIHLTRNFGQHNALLCGISYANGKYIITLDV